MIKIMPSPTPSGSPGSSLVLRIAGRAQGDTGLGDRDKVMPGVRLGPRVCGKLNNEFISALRLVPNLVR
jgi:hypothetical protein